MASLQWWFHHKSFYWLESSEWLTCWIYLLFSGIFEIKINWFKYIQSCLCFGRIKLLITLLKLSEYTYRLILIVHSRIEFFFQIFSWLNTCVRLGLLNYEIQWYILHQIRHFMLPVLEIHFLPRQLWRQKKTQHTQRVIFSYAHKTQNPNKPQIKFK